MDITILQENLLKALTRTGRILSAKPQLPVLANVKIDTEEGRFRCTATNLETTETVWMGAKISTEGGICIPSKLLTELVVSLPQDNVRLTVKDLSLNLTCAGTHATIPGISLEEFPQVSIKKKTKEAQLDASVFRDAVSQVIFAASSDDTRPLLTGVKFKKTDHQLLIAATDGYRLSLKKVDAENIAVEDVVVSARALGEVMKLCQEEKDLRKLLLGQTSDGQLQFTLGDTEIITRLIDGDYPDFEKVIPKQTATRVMLDKQQFTRAVKSVAIFSRDNANIIRLLIKNKSVEVSARAAQAGEGDVTIDAEVDGEGGEIAFNSRFLQEFLSNIPSDQVVFEMTGSLNPGVFKVPKDESFLHVIMPVRTTSG